MESESELNLSLSAEGVTYYGIYSKSEKGNLSPEKAEKLVYTDKNEVMRILKSNKKARFKAFSKEDDATLFSLNGCDVENRENVLSMQSNDKSAFKAPKPQELVKFRMAIEKHNSAFVFQCINDNPRFLISSGDTPSILQEGTRYNALHICARSNNARICSYILNTIGDTKFIERMYSTKIGSNERCKILLDLYLNTPDKALNETPLHYASKLGALEVVKALVLHEQCDRYLLNKFHESPMDIICTRASGEAAKNKAAIKDALEATFFVPILRSPDSTVQPIVGAPFSPSSPSKLQVFNNSIDSPRTPPMQISALAGPMSEGKASSFRKIFKTPSRDRATYLKSPSRIDPDKGLEKVGRDLALKFEIPWKEYWDFLDTYVDLSSNEGLELLESHLQKKVLHSQTEHSSSSGLPPNLVNGHNLIGKQTKSLEKSLLPSLASNLLSPVSELCADLEKLHLLELETPEDCDTSFDSNTCITNSYQIYANHIAAAIKRKSSNNLVQAVNQLQCFIASCSCDIRFNKVNFSECHYIISDIIYNMIGANTQQELNFLKQLIDNKSTLQHPNLPYYVLNSVCEASKCIALFLIDALEGTNEKEGLNADEPIANCKCKLARSSRPKKMKKNWSRKLDLVSHPSKTNQKSNTYEKNDQVSDESDEFEDNLSDTSKYSTPDETSDEDDFVEANGHKEDFLTGSVPTKLDLMVLEAIKDVTISQSDYPFIYFWKTSCLSYASRCPQEKWSTPKKLKY